MNNRIFSLADIFVCVAIVAGMLFIYLSIGLIAVPVFFCIFSIMKFVDFAKTKSLFLLSLFFLVVSAFPGVFMHTSGRPDLVKLAELHMVLLLFAADRYHAYPAHLIPKFVFYFWAASVIVAFPFYRFRKAQ